MSYTTDDIRNIALLGQAGAGKTMLSEAILHQAGIIPTKGEIERKNTVSDQDLLEKQHQRSLTASVLSFDYQGRHVNLIDTPGYSDFAGQALKTIQAVETVIIVINASSGIETMTRRFFERVREENVSTAIVINRMDMPDVNLEKVYQSIQEEFGSECLAVNLPSENGAAVVGCLYNSGGHSDFSSVDDENEAITDQIVEVDDDLMEFYLEEGEIDDDQIQPAFQQAMKEGHLIPVCFTSATQDTGIAELLALMAELLPSPNAVSPRRLVWGERDNEQIDLEASLDSELIASVFKIAFDPFVGKLAVFRIYQGQLNKDAFVYVDDNRKTVRFSNLYALRGKQNIDVARGIPGDILGIAKVAEVMQDSIVHETIAHVVAKIDAPRTQKPMVGLAVTPASRGDEQKVSESMHKIAAEDPCISIDRNPAANETILRGMGDLHLRIALERLKEVYHVEVETSIPTVPYKETVTRLGEGHCRHKKQTGGAGQFGEVFMRAEPLPRGEGFEFVDNIVGGVIPSQFIPAVEKGVKQVLENGAFAGFPIEDVRVVIYDGKHHSVDSKEVAFVTAGKKAFIDAISKAGPIILEPIADVEVVVPSVNMGDIAGELASRRGRISDTDTHSSGFIQISCAVPVAEMSDFQSRLNAISGGEGAFTMEFGSYEPAPVEVQRRLSAEYNQPDDD